jgi:hypothetical protein
MRWGNRPSDLWIEAMIEAPRGQRGRHARKELAAKARNHLRVASAFLHSEGIAYKLLCGEILMCPRMGRMGSIKQ